MSGKGSKQRPTNHAAFSDNFDAIFKKKKPEQEAALEELSDLGRQIDWVEELAGGDSDD